MGKKNSQIFREHASYKIFTSYKASTSPQQQKKAKVKIKSII
jgi:hypothetical protein